jgi:hypothetical protein
VYGVVLVCGCGIIWNMFVAEGCLIMTNVDKLVQAVIAANGERAGCNDCDEENTTWLYKAIANEDWDGIEQFISYGVKE